MQEIWSSLVPFIAILNPLALCLYLVGVMEDLERPDFARVLVWACAISFATFFVFALAGEPLLVDVLGVQPGALRAFGGIIFLIVGYNYVVKGYRTTEALRGSLRELPSAIALPFMIGGGTITQAILVGKRHSPLVSAAVLSAGVAICFVVVITFNVIRDHMQGDKERIFDRYVNIMVRINGLMIGAISVDMVISGVRQLWTQT